MAADLVQRVHSVAYGMLVRISEKAGREYNDKMDETYSRIQSCVMLSAPERSYNIVLALIRIIGSLNKELTCRYNFAPARELAAIPSMLSDCGIKDYGIDNILNVNINQ